MWWEGALLLAEFRGERLLGFRYRLTHLSAGDSIVECKYLALLYFKSPPRPGSWYCDICLSCLCILFLLQIVVLFFLFRISFCLSSSSLYRYVYFSTNCSVLSEYFFFISSILCKVINCTWDLGKPRTAVEKEKGEGGGGGGGEVLLTSYGTGVFWDCLLDCFIRNPWHTAIRSSKTWGPLCRSAETPSDSIHLICTLNLPLLGAKLEKNWRRSHKCWEFFGKVNDFSCAEHL